MEGLRELTCAVAHDVWVETLLICPEIWKDTGRAEALVREAEAADVEILELDTGAFGKVSFRESPDGLIGVAVKREFLLEGAALPPNPLVMVVEKVEKPGNLGAILRTADAAGVDCVLCCDPVTDIFNPHVIRNSQGLVFALPVFIAPWEKCHSFLQSAGVPTYATTPSARTPLWEADLSGPAALLLGGEKDGLSARILEAADHRVLIPMQGAADSLNVSVAAAVCLFEAARQRQAKAPDTE